MTLLNLDLTISAEVLSDKNKIIWKGPLLTDEKDYINNDDVINISTKDNERYLCIVPNDNMNQLNFDTSARNSSTTEKVKTPIQILEPLLNGNQCSYKFELFWIYELCHGKFLRQYHEEKAKLRSKITQEYYLGKIEEDQLKAHQEEYDKQTDELERTGQSRPTILVNGQHKPYVMFNMTGGTKCDLTKKSRVSKIIYVCNEEPYSLEVLYSIKEISTCEYEAIVLTPKLCQHKDFKVETDTHHEIKCYSLDGAPDRPKKTIEFEDDENEDGENGLGSKNWAKKRGIAYLQGRTLIIDADLLLS